jgi:hypothetical protein
MTQERIIDVKPQTKLSLQKSLRFCTRGIAYRLFRSSLTLAVVVVAVAFFMVLLTESVIIGSVATGIRGQTVELREADQFMAHVTSLPSLQSLRNKLSAAADDEAAITEYARVSGVTDTDIANLTASCAAERQYLKFFADLSVGKRSILIKRLIGSAIFEHLADDEAWSEFASDLVDMMSVRLPGGEDSFRTFLDEYDAYRSNLANFHTTWHGSIKKLSIAMKPLVGETDAATWLADASPEKRAEWQKLVSEHGFDIEDAKLDRVTDLLSIAVLKNRVVRALQTSDKRAAWKKAFKRSHGNEEKLLLLEDARANEILESAYSADDRAKLVAQVTHESKLRTTTGRLEGKAAPEGETAMLSGRQIFLVVISFVVCMVGIANAMLMSITERFREIATMKCLGATDEFILSQFLIEAAIQGVIGGLVGMLVGLIIAIGKNGLLFGSVIFDFFPLTQVALAACFTIVAGVLLAMLASVYPSWTAARMAPMDAMRVE